MTVPVLVASPQSTEAYRSIGGGSPLRKITDEQARALEGALRRLGVDAKVYVAMRYWNPFTEEAVADIKRDGVTRLVVLPLYPQFSISTSGSSLRLLEQLMRDDPSLRELKHTVIPSWYQRPGYVRAMADLIQDDLNSKFSDASAVHLFFSAHGVPKSYVDEAGDPYKEEMEECVSLIVAELRRRGVENPFTLAYQSRVGPVEWLQPYTEDAIERLGKEGCPALLAVPISFVSEHIETLEEIDMEYRRGRAGGRCLGRCFARRRERGCERSVAGPPRPQGTGPRVWDQGVGPRAGAQHQLGLHPGPGRGGGGGAAVCGHGGQRAGQGPGAHGRHRLAPGDLRRRQPAAAHPGGVAVGVGLDEERRAVERPDRHGRVGHRPPDLHAADDRAEPGVHVRTPRGWRRVGWRARAASCDRYADGGLARGQQRRPRFPGFFLLPDFRGDSGTAVSSSSRALRGADWWQCAQFWLRLGVVL